MIMDLMISHLETSIMNIEMAVKNNNVRIYLLRILSIKFLGIYLDLLLEVVRACLVCSSCVHMSCERGL